MAASSVTESNTDSFHSIASSYVDMWKHACVYENSLHFTFSKQDPCHYAWETLRPLPLGQSINTLWKPLLQRETNYVASEE